MPTPSVAVAIPTRHRSKSLARLMDALLAQSHRPNEILIIDDEQLDGNFVARWRGRCDSSGIRLVYHRKAAPEAPGRSASRNLAGTMTGCQTVCFLDDDCEPTPQFLERMLAGLQTYGRWQLGDTGESCATGGLSASAPPGTGGQAASGTQEVNVDALVAVEGLVIPPGGSRLGDRVYAGLLFLSGWWRLARCRRPRKLGDNLQGRAVLCGACLVRRDALNLVRFDESLAHGEDREWSVRLARLGRIARVTDAVCYHHFDPAGRHRAFGTGVRIARNYLHSQRKLFGGLGVVAAVFTLTALAAGELIFGTVASLLYRRSGPRYLLRSAGLFAGCFSPRGPHADG